MDKVTVAIHQPNFFPWLGFFDKMAKSDVFVLLDDVQFPKTGGTYTNRVELLLNGKRSWLTAPKDRDYRGVRTILEMRFAEQEDWRHRIIHSLSLNYGKHPCFCEAMEVLEPLVRNPESGIAAYNVSALTAMALRLGLLEGRSVVRASDLGVEATSTERLAVLTRMVGGTTYLAGGGAASYQEDEVFEHHGIELRFQSFVHPVYEQSKADSFEPGLSVIDAVMNVGWEAVGSMLRSIGESARAQHFGSEARGVGGEFRDS